MTTIFKIANIDETILYNLLSASNHIRLISRSISDQTSQDGEPVDIKFDTIAKGTSTEIRTDMEALERLLQRAIDWVNDETEQESIWLHAASDQETEKRTLILNWQRTDTTQGLSDPMLDDVTMIISQWVITRAPYWEALDADAITISNSLMSDLSTGAFDNSVNGGHATWAPGSYHKGTAPGRIESLTPIISSTTGSNYWKKLWFGMKKIKDATATFAPDIKGSFVSISAYVNNAYVDINAVNNVASEVAWTGTEEFSPRIARNMTATVDTEALRGTYMLLAKMRTDASTVVRTAAFITWDILSTVTWPVDALATADTLQDVYVSSNKYHFYEMGIIQIPPEGYRFARRDAQDNFIYLRAGLSAGLISGAGKLYLDHFSLIPMDHFISINNLNEGDLRFCYTVTDELNNTVGFTEATSGIPRNRYMHELSLNNWTWPVAETGDLMISVAAADIEIDDADSEHPPVGTNEEGYSVALAFKVIPRYLSYNND